MNTDKDAMADKGKGRVGKTKKAIIRHRTFLLALMIAIIAAAALLVVVKIIAGAMHLDDSPLLDYFGSAFGGIITIVAVYLTSREQRDDIRREEDKKYQPYLVFQLDDDTGTQSPDLQASSRDRGNSRRIKVHFSGIDEAWDPSDKTTVSTKLFSGSIINAGRGSAEIRDMHVEYWLTCGSEGNPLAFVPKLTKVRMHETNIKPLTGNDLIELNEEQDTFAPHESLNKTLPSGKAHKFCFDLVYSKYEIAEKEFRSCAQDDEKTKAEKERSAKALCELLEERSTKSSGLRMVTFLTIEYLGTEDGSNQHKYYCALIGSHYRVDADAYGYFLVEDTSKQTTLWALEEFNSQGEIDAFKEKMKLPSSTESGDNSVPCD